ncbi:MAG TPA: hypothetical protein VFL03_11005 [Candidatus Limnocylindrales bacterium]|nr:hypothetical protein [Candidatus Limnocylindrales bacterium]
MFVVPLAIVAVAAAGCGATPGPLPASCPVVRLDMSDPGAPFDGSPECVVVVWDDAMDPGSIGADGGVSTSPVLELAARAAGYAQGCEHSIDPGGADARRFHGRFGDLSPTAQWWTVTLYRPADVPNQRMCEAWLATF